MGYAFLEERHYLESAFHFNIISSMTPKGNLVSKSDNFQRIGFSSYHYFFSKVVLIKSQQRSIYLLQMLVHIHLHRWFP